MTLRVTRAPYAIDSDSLMILGIDRLKELAERKRKLEVEEERIKKVLAQTMRDNEAKEMTIAGLPVARLVEYDRRTVKVDELLAQFPMAVTLVTTTPVVQVRLP